MKESAQDLKRFSTVSLVEELATREGVQHIWVHPYSPYQVTVMEDTVTDEGPARLLIVID